MGLESFSRGMEIGKTTIFRQNRPVKFRLEMVNGSVVEIIPANSEFKITPQDGDIKKFDIIIEDTSLRRQLNN
jgi:23S rRNA-/tRNA-specific pseudouridylate synthase